MCGCKKCPTNGRGCVLVLCNWQVVFHNVQMDRHIIIYIYLPLLGGCYVYRVTIKVLLAVKGDNLLSDSDYILLESDYIL